jgi:hypothetical protein
MAMASLNACACVRNNALSLGTTGLASPPDMVWRLQP